MNNKDLGLVLFGIICLGILVLLFMLTVYTPATIKEEAGETVWITKDLPGGGVILELKSDDRFIMTIYVWNPRKTSVSDGSYKIINNSEIILTLGKSREEIKGLFNKESSLTIEIPEGKILLFKIK